MAINLRKLKLLFIIFGVQFFIQTVQANHVYCHNNKGKVSRASFTTQIVNREPVDEVLVLANDVTELYFFSDLRNFDGHTITHKWEYEGKAVQRKMFDVKGPRWRVYSKHKIDPLMLGKWSVIIVDENDCPIKAVRFNYVKGGKGKSKILKVEQ